MNTSISIVYFSGGGHTHLMAEALADGARRVPQTVVHLHRITDAQFEGGRWSDDAVMKVLEEADAIVFGAPTYMGGPAAQFKAFVDASSGVWFNQGWKDKLAGGFTHSSSARGDMLNTLQNFAIIAAEHGMHYLASGDLPGVVSGEFEDLERQKFSLGVAGQTLIDVRQGEPEISGMDRDTARRYGRRIAEATRRWTRGNLALSEREG